MDHKVKIIVPAVLLGIIVLISVFAPVLAPYDPLRVDLKAALLPCSAEHWLGTDAVGRDVLSRVLYGGRQSMVLALAATVLSMCLGLAVGLAAGYFGGAVDTVLTTVSSMFQGLPGTSMMIAVASIMGKGIPAMLTAIVLTSWVGFSRLVRGEVMRIRQEDYIESLESMAASHPRILLLHIAPNLFSSVIVVFTTRIAGVLLSVAALSFLGLGLQPPTPDWGAMINDAKGYFRQHPMLLMAPGLCIVAVSLCVNSLGDALRDYFDVRCQSTGDIG